MNDTVNQELPVFPAVAPEVFADRSSTTALFEPVMAELARVVEIPTERLGDPTPCAGYDVAALRRHVLGWLQFFAAALSDPDGQAERLDPDSWDLAPGQSPAEIVHAAAADIATAIDAGVADRLVVMAQARMPGGAVLAMALGEYLVHGWDLATAVGRPWPPATPGPEADAAATGALAFLQNTVQPEYRGPESGFFDDEVPAPTDATAFERLLCFGGRQPAWSATST